jgi:hypothetical protein
MTPLHHLLEVFYERYGPQAIAFVGSNRFGTSVGHLSAACASISDATAGSSQYHIEGSNLSIYVSSFGWGKFLIAQFVFQKEYPPPAREWLAFVRLAAAVTLLIETPDEEDSGAAGVAVLRPRPSPLRTPAAEAPFEDRDALPWRGPVENAT